MTTTVIPDLDRARTRFWKTELAAVVESNPDAFIRLIVRQRVALGFSQRQLAERSGVSFTAINDLERRKYPTTTTHTIRAIMTGLGLTIDDIRAEVAAMHDDETAAAMVASLAA